MHLNPKPMKNLRKKNPKLFVAIICGLFILSTAAGILLHAIIG